MCFYTNAKHGDKSADRTERRQGGTSGSSRKASHPPFSQSKWVAILKMKYDGRFINTKVFVGIPRNPTNNKIMKTRPTGLWSGRQLLFRYVNLCELESVLHLGS